jgi:hypothetical protein
MNSNGANTKNTGPSRTRQLLPFTAATDHGVRMIFFFKEFGDRMNQAESNSTRPKLC